MTSSLAAAAAAAASAHSSICTQQLHTVAVGAPKAPWLPCSLDAEDTLGRLPRATAPQQGVQELRQSNFSQASQCFHTWKSLWSSGSQDFPASSFTATGSHSPRPSAGVSSPQALGRELQGRAAWVELLQEPGKNRPNGITSTKTCQDVLFPAKL